MDVRVDALQIGAAFGEQYARVEVDAEQRQTLVDQLLRQLAGHVADGQAYRVHERALLDPPAQRVRRSFLARRIKTVRRTKLLDDAQDQKGIAVKFRADLQNRRPAITAGHRRQFWTRRPDRNLDRAPAQPLEAEREANLLRVRRQLIVMQDRLWHLFLLFPRSVGAFWRAPSR